MTKTGYDSPEDDRAAEDRGDDHYSVEMQRISTHEHVCAVVKRNGAAIGYLPCDSEEEFLWFRERLTGTRHSS